MRIVYVSGAISAPNKETYRYHVNIAKAHALALWRLGYGVFCPHMNTDFGYELGMEIPYESFMEFDFSMLANCDAVLMLPNWRHSKGAGREHALAASIGKPIFYSIAGIIRWGEGHAVHQEL